MKSISILFYLTVFFFLHSCAGPETESLADSNIEDISIQITSRSLESPNSPEELDSLLSRKWENESTEVVFKLNNDKSFEGDFDNYKSISGKWNVSEDLHTLHLTSEITGDTSTFEKSFMIMEITTDNMTLHDDEGNQLVLSSK